jgi:hypothetical protein
MRRTLGIGLVIGVALLIGSTSAQRGAPPIDPNEPTLGNWRGTMKSPQGDNPFIITIVKKGAVYSGSTTGFGGTNEIPLKRVTITGNRVAVETEAESKLGYVVLTTDLAVEGNAMKGPGTIAVGPHKFDVTIELQRRARADVIQPQVEQRVDYFVGRWTFEYLGGEFPPLSAGTRTGTATFTRSGTSDFIVGQIDGDAAGKRYQERLSMGFDPATKTLAVVERRSDATELMSVANWQSPLAITFHTSPVQASGRTYQLRRVISVFSDVAFDVTEDFSVDGGPFRRLGTARFTKQ